MNPQALIQRLSELQAEGQAIMQQLASIGMAEEDIMAALQGGMPQPAVPAGPQMGGGPGPDLPMPQGMGAPAGLLGDVR